MSTDIKENLIANLCKIIFFLKTKIEPYVDEATDFHDKEVLKVDYTCLAAINLNSVLKKHENYYQQVFLKECKYIEKE